MWMLQQKSVSKKQHGLSSSDMLRGLNMLVTQKFLTYWRARTALLIQEVWYCFALVAAQAGETTPNASVQLCCMVHSYGHAAMQWLWKGSVSNCPRVHSFL
mmetsp:Transcript_68775/g.201413  ORF Transcript_68775/g.201413 Transcript_68775/m.201413 type:complete len:101 (-) Transcript_68775:755-1057(-)